MSGLPKGWVKCLLGDLVDYGKTTKADMKAVKPSTWVLELEDIEKDTSKILKKLCFKERLPKSSKNIFTKGDVLYGKLRPYLNKMLIADDDGICTSEIVPLKVVPSLVDNRFLFYWLKGRVFSDYVNFVSYGVNMPRLGTKDGKNAPMILAPLPEQKRIVEKLDEVLAQVDSIKARLDGIPNIIKRFRQSVLTAAVSGKLTEELFVGTSFSESELKNISNQLFTSGLTKGNFGKKLARAAEFSEAEKLAYQSRFPMIRVGEISGSIVPNRDKPRSFSGHTPWILTPYLKEQSVELEKRSIEFGLSDEEIVKYNARLIPEGSTIMTCVGRLGLSAVTTFDCVINQQLHAFTGSEYLNNRYLAFVIRAYEHYFYSTSTSTTVQYLNKSACNSMPLPLPRIEEQTEIVRLVDQYFAFADTIEAQVKKAQARVDNLTQSILAKAFRGELVPQNPNDEPADKLLERIATARKEAEALAKAAKKVVKVKK